MAVRAFQFYFFIVAALASLSLLGNELLAAPQSSSTGAVIPFYRSEPPPIQAKKIHWMDNFANIWERRTTEEWYYLMSHSSARNVLADFQRFVRDLDRMPYETKRNFRTALNRYMYEKLAGLVSNHHRINVNLDNLSNLYAIRKENSIRQVPHDAYAAWVTGKPAQDVSVLHFGGLQHFAHRLAGEFREAEAALVLWAIIGLFQNQKIVANQLRGPTIPELIYVGRAVFITNYWNTETLMPESFVLQVFEQRHQFADIFMELVRNPNIKALRESGAYETPANYEKLLRQSRDLYIRNYQASDTRIPTFQFNAEVYASPEWALVAPAFRAEIEPFLRKEYIGQSSTVEDDFFRESARAWLAERMRDRDFDSSRNFEELHRWLEASHKAHGRGDVPDMRPPHETPGPIVGSLPWMTDVVLRWKKKCGLF